MRPSTPRRLAVAVLVAGVALGSGGPVLAARTDSAAQCKDDAAAVRRLDISVGGENTWGLYALPPRTPKGIVVFAHGYGHTAESWRGHIAATARRNGVIAVAMNYRRQTDYPPAPGQALPTSRGWRVAEGAEDSIAAAKFFQARCRTATTIVMYGVSMGGNTAGLAVAAGAQRVDAQGRPNGPLFDYWFDIEGATNVTETYFEARALALSGNATAVNAVEDIRAEMGGHFEEGRSDTYLERSVVTRAEDIAATNPDLGVVMVHGVDDGLVGYNQSPEMFARLRQVGLPVDFWTALTRGSASEPGTTLDGYVTGSVPGYTSPFAGHASEASTTHIVGTAGFERLAALFAGDVPACRVGVLDGTTGHTQTNPLTGPPTC